MRFQAESWAVYRKANNAAKKEVKKLTKQEMDPYLKSLASILREGMVAKKVLLGVLDIPTEKIVGIEKEDGREQYTTDFLPLPAPDGEFASKWCKLYWYYISNKGLNCPITCYEYLGEFYIIDGLKRASIAKCHGIPNISASVTRLLPVMTEDPAVQQYYDFVKCFEKTRLYEISFSKPYSFERFQKALGFEVDHVWNESDRLDFLFNWHVFEYAFQEAYNGYLTITPADVFLVLLDEHPYEKLREMHPMVLIQMMRNSWDKIYAIQNAKSSHC